MTATSIRRSIMHLNSRCYRKRLAQVPLIVAQVPLIVVPVRFWAGDLRRKSPLYDLQWRRNPSQNPTCAILSGTGAKMQGTCAIWMKLQRQIARDLRYLDETPAPKCWGPAPPLTVTSISWETCTANNHCTLNSGAGSTHDWLLTRRM